MFETEIDIDQNSYRNKYDGNKSDEYYEKRVRFGVTGAGQGDYMTDRECDRTNNTIIRLI